MPLYDYQCRKCGHVTTFLEKAGEKHEHPCEKCQANDTTRLFSSFQVNEKENKSTCTTGTCPFN
ncbi:MAG: zinc ribbon domain-containing protein [Candidatus Riflebacteria bacterium]